MSFKVFLYVVKKLLLLSIFTVHGCDGDTNQMSIYMLGCIKNRHSLNQLTFDVVVLNSNLDNVHVSISSHDGQARNFTVQSRGVHTEHFPSDVEVVGSTLSRKGIKVTSDRQLFVYGISQRVNGFEGFLSLPTHYQGNHYFIITEDSGSEFLIVGIYPNTCVHIILRSQNTKIEYNGKTYVNGSTIIEVLNECSTMQIQTGSDFTGTEIRSSRPVSVFNGNEAVGDKNQRNHLVEQLPPFDNWGKEYVTVAPQGFTYNCKIISGFPDTLVNYTCSTNVVENLYLPEAGSFKTLTFGNSNCFLISNKPILITIMVARDNGRPCLITLPAPEEVQGETMVYVPAAIENAQLVIVTNVSITLKSVNSTTDTSKHVTCPNYINRCIIHVENLGKNQTYTISTMDQPFVVSGYIHGTSSRGRGIGYPILHLTNRNEQATSEHVDVTCGESTELPGSSTEGPPSPLVLNNSCQCCSFMNYYKDLEETLKLLRDELYVQPKMTNLYIRSLMSAPDHRVSSKVIGYTCGCVLGMFGIGLVLLDMEISRRC